MAMEHRGVPVANTQLDGGAATGVGGLDSGRLIPVGLSALLEGLGQAYLRQPVRSSPYPRVTEGPEWVAILAQRV